MILVTRLKCESNLCRSRLVCNQNGPSASVPSWFTGAWRALSNEKPSARCWGGWGWLGYAEHLAEHAGGVELMQGHSVPTGAVPQAGQGKRWRSHSIFENILIIAPAVRPQVEVLNLAGRNPGGVLTRCCLWVFFSSWTLAVSHTWMIWSLMRNIYRLWVHLLCFWDVSKCNCAMISGRFQSWFFFLSMNLDLKQSRFCLLVCLWHENYISFRSFFHPVFYAIYHKTIKYFFYLKNRLIKYIG